MNKGEKELFKCLCSFRSNSFDESLLKFATPEVLGHLFFNRMHSIAYGNLLKRGLLHKVNREFRNSLKAGYDISREKNAGYFKLVAHVEKILRNCNCKFALLKGAYLCRYYPVGYRTSNDIDLLVAPDNVSIISKALSDAGFKQGHIENEVFIPASRKEIIESKMTRGETVPFIKRVEYPHMKFLEVDVNFSLDYKNGIPTTLREMLEEGKYTSVCGMNIPTLDNRDFFIHLCSHLYKESSSMPWVRMQRDMTLYKYCDIYLLLSDMNEERVDEIFKRAKELHLDKICAFAILHTAQLFDLVDSYAINIAIEILKDDPEFIHRVMSPADGKMYIYQERDVFERLFNSNRISLLNEVITDETS